MQYNFCTLFDSNYLHKGLALYESLCNVNADFHLYIVAFDDKCYEFLSGLKLEHLTVSSLPEFETAELLAVKPSRTRAEYCWTSTASVIYHFIQKHNLDHCTYLDADMMFFQSPKVIFDEIGDNSVAITEHIPDGPDMLAGKYCVQFVYFKNDTDGMKALTWWKDSCIDWCFARYEDGKFGDQKYLDYFPSKFQKVHVVKHKGAGVAPWNIHLYDFKEFGKIYFQDKPSDIVFFHFHGTKVNTQGDEIIIDVVTSDVTSDVEINIYMPYLKLIGNVYHKYLNRKYIRFKVKRRSLIKRYMAKIKLLFRKSNLVRQIYYKFIRKQFEGREEKQL